MVLRTPSPSDRRGKAAKRGLVTPRNRDRAFDRGFVASSWHLLHLCKPPGLELKRIRQTPAFVVVPGSHLTAATCACLARIAAAALFSSTQHEDSLAHSSPSDRLQIDVIVSHSRLQDASLRAQPARQATHTLPVVETLQGRLGGPPPTRGVACSRPSRTLNAKQHLPELVRNQATPHLMAIKYMGYNAFQPTSETLASIGRTPAAHNHFRSPTTRMASTRVTAKLGRSLWSSDTSLMNV